MLRSAGSASPLLAAIGAPRGPAPLSPHPLRHRLANATHFVTPHVTHPLRRREAGIGGAQRSRLDTSRRLSDQRDGSSTSERNAHAKVTVRRRIASEGSAAAVRTGGVTCPQRTRGAREAGHRRWPSEEPQANERHSVSWVPRMRIVDRPGERDMRERRTEGEERHGAARPHENET